MEMRVSIPTQDEKRSVAMKRREGRMILADPVAAAFRSLMVVSDISVIHLGMDLHFVDGDGKTVFHELDRIVQDLLTESP